MGKEITPTVSAIIITDGNIDEKLLEKCLASLSWCNEIIKVKTEGIKGNFADWRNAGAKLAKSKWILYVDSDEEVPSNLKDEIQKALQTTYFTAYAIPRKNIFFGTRRCIGEVGILILS